MASFEQWRRNRGATASVMTEKAKGERAQAMAPAVDAEFKGTQVKLVKPFVEADFDKEWGWLGLDKELEVELSRRPVLVASRIVGGNNSTAVIVNAGDPHAPVGTSGGAARATGGGAITAIASLGNAGEDMIGRSVDLTGVSVRANAKDRGFFVKSGDTVVFVLPEPNLQANVRQGETVSIEGMVLQMPRHMDDQLSSPSGGTLNEDIYVYATRIER